MPSAQEVDRYVKSHNLKWMKMPDGREVLTSNGQIVIPDNDLMGIYEVRN